MALIRYCREHAIDILESRPPCCRFLLPKGSWRASGRSGYAFGGEAVSEAVWQALQKVPSIAAYNVYGPTECTVRRHDMPRNSSRKRPVIGRPLRTPWIYILSRYQQPVPIGVPGELYIGGLPVGRGYLNQPQHTAARFLNHPFADSPEARMYRTGDIARFFASGDIEFLGREDDQVKLRGYRIELGEVEAVLRRHPAVRDCVVLLRRDRGTEPRLVGM